MGVSENGVRLVLNDICKSFATKKGEVQQVVDHVSLEVKNNEFLVILGPGYCGKTVLLNMIMNLLPPDSGQVLLDGEEINK